MTPATATTTPAMQAARMGISGSTISPGSTAALYMSDPHGAFISAVTPGSSADRAGLKQGDVVQSFNGLRVSNYDDLNDLVNKSASGSVVKLGVWRGQKAVTVSIAM